MSKKVMLLVGGLYHPFEAAAHILTAALEGTGEFSVDVREDRDALKEDSLQGYDAVVSYLCAGEFTPEQESGLVAFVHNGGAYIGVHGATTIRGEHPQYDVLIGGAFDGHGPAEEFSVYIVDAGHCIALDVQDFRLFDELYMLRGFDAGQSHVLAEAEKDGKRHPVAYTKTSGQGRVYYLALGHDERALEHRMFLRLFVQGAKWCVEERR